MREKKEDETGRHKFRQWYKESNQFFFLKQRGDAVDQANPVTQFSKHKTAVDSILYSYLRYVTYSPAQRRYEWSVSGWQPTSSSVVHADAYIGASQLQIRLFN